MCGHCASHDDGGYVAPGGPALLLFTPLCLTALMAATAQILASQHEKRSRGQLI